MKTLKPNKYNISIDIARIIAMLMVLVCHLGTHYQNPAISQFFEIGVEIFLIISGYLSFTNPRVYSFKYIWKRIKRLYFPIFVFSAFTAVLLFMANELDLREYFIACTGVTGINNIFIDADLVGTPGMTHLWFVFILLMCNIAEPLYRCVLRRFNFGTGVFLMFVVHCLLLVFGVNLRYFIAFGIGYLYRGSNLNTKEKGDAHAVATSVASLFLAGVFIRLLGKKILDGAFAYVNLLIPFSSILIALSILWGVFSLSARICRNPTARLVDICRGINALTYDIYIVHYMFIEGAFSVFFINTNEAVKIFVFILSSAVSAICLHLLYDRRLFLGKKNECK